MKIGIDLDDVVFPLVEPACLERGINHHLVQTWDDLFQVFEGNLWEFLKESGIYARLELAPGARGVLLALHGEGHDLRFVTSRPDWANEATLSCLERTLPELRASDRLVHAAGSKLEADCQVYVDDAPHHLTEIFEAGRTAICFDQPWNQHITVSFRAYNWRQVRGYLRTMTEWGHYAPALENI